MEATKEQILYLNVIIQLVEDYAFDTPVGTNLSESNLAKIQANSWFTNNSEDYQEVCDYAGINAKWLRKRVLSSDPKHLQRLINDIRAEYITSSLRN